MHEFTDPPEFFVTFKPNWQCKQQPFPFSSCRAEPRCGSGGQALDQWQLDGFKPHMAAHLCYYLVIELDIESPLLQRMAVILRGSCGQAEPRALLTGL